MGSEIFISHIRVPLFTGMITRLYLSLVMISFLPIQGALFGDPDDAPGNYPHIRELLTANKTGEAQREINRLIKSNDNDPTLSLFQTEIWIQLGEKNYLNRNYRSAYDYYKRAHNFWPNQPLVQLRYKDLKSRNLFNTDTDVSKTKAVIVEAKTNVGLKESQSKLIYIIDSGSGSDDLKQMLSEIRTDLKGIRESREGNTSSAGEVITITKPMFLIALTTVGILIAGLILAVLRINGKLKRTRNTN